MASNIRYFIGNWKMFGIPSSFKILNRINTFCQKDKKNNRKYKIIIAPPFTLLHDFAKRFRTKKILLSAQNCYDKDNFGAYTGYISPLMIKKIGIHYVIIGHSESRASGETDTVIKNKISLAMKNNFTIIYCIGENKKDRNKKKTLFVLKKQILNGLKKNYNFNKIIIAYEPIWSIGTGKVPTFKELQNNAFNLKKFIKKKFKLKCSPKLLYGGSVDKNSINGFKSIQELDGFLIGGASKSSKNFIDIIKNFYK